MKNTEAEKGRAADKIANAVGMHRSTLVKAAAVVEAATAHPETYVDLAAQMDATGKVAPAYNALAARAAEPDAPAVNLPYRPTVRPAGPPLAPARCNRNGSRTPA